MNGEMSGAAFELVPEEQAECMAHQGAHQGHAKQRRVFSPVPGLPQCGHCGSSGLEDSWRGWSGGAPACS